MPNVSGELTWIAARAGIGHGLLVWFDTRLAEDVGFSNAPAAPELIYGGAFFPWATPVSIAVSDNVTVALRADLVGEDYIWGWDTVVMDRAQPGQAKASFKQSTFFGAPLSPALLHKLSASHVPQLNEDGQIDQWVLALMAEGTPLGEIAVRASERFPARFADSQAALTRVGTLAQRYSL